MSNKSKGSRAERELLQIFTDHIWRAARVAGSGVNENTFCDLIAGKSGKAYAVEAKSSKKKRIYITKKQIDEFIQFAEVMGLTPVIAARFNREGWFFIEPQLLEKSDKYFTIGLDLAKEKGKRFGQFFQEEKDSFMQ
ncbi:MAG: Holliday junction resolvase Hjc [Nanoarchaeota archaeon]